MKNQIPSLFRFVAVISLMTGTSCINGIDRLDNELIQTNTATQRALSNVSVDYAVQDDWGSGFVANVTITNNSGSAINGWSVTWTFPNDQQITNAWNADVSQSGNAVTAEGVDWNSTIPDGGSVNFGFQGTYSSSNDEPSDFAVNGESSDDDSGGDDSGGDDSGGDDSGSAGDVSVPNGYAQGTTGGGDASPTTVSSASAFRSAVSGSGSAVIIVNGRIDLGGDVTIDSNKTIKGANSNSGLYGGTVKIQGTNYIIQNLTFGPSDDDVVEVSGATMVFIHKCTFHDSTDELLSIVRQADYVTVSWCKFYFDSPDSHSYAHLIGNGDDVTEDRGKLHVTMHHNWYTNGVQGRMPRVRFGYVHLYNNYYNSNNTDYCIGIGVECHIRLENTHFDNVDDPWADYGGTDNGEIGWSNLKFEGTSQPSFMSNSFPVFSPPYSFTLDSVDNVESIVKAGAGNVF